jgi:hypothetical protein
MTVIPDVKENASHFSNTDTRFVSPLRQCLIKAIQGIRFSIAGQHVAADTAGEIQQNRDA